jgi:hypothetical protein
LLDLGYLLITVLLRPREAARRLGRRTSGPSGSP